MFFRILEYIKTPHGEIVKPRQKQLSQKLCELDTQHYAVGIAVNDLINESKQLAVLDIQPILSLEQIVLNILEIMVYIHGQAIECVLLWRGKDVLLDNLVEEMRATPLGTSWTVVRNLGSQLIFTGVHGCMLNDMIANRQLIDYAMLGFFNRLGLIV